MEDKGKEKLNINVLIPFRDRDEDIRLSLPKINDSLIALNLNPTFFIAEQANDLPFNRGMLFNAGFLEAKKKLTAATGFSTMSIFLKKLLGT